MHFQVGGDVAVDEVQEPPELLGPMPRGEIGDDVAGGDVQSGVEAGRAVPDIVVRLPLRGLPAAVC